MFLLVEQKCKYQINDQFISESSTNNQLFHCVRPYMRCRVEIQSFRWVRHVLLQKRRQLALQKANASHEEKPTDCSPYSDPRVSQKRQRPRVEAFDEISKFLFYSYSEPKHRLLDSNENAFCRDACRPDARNSGTSRVAGIRVPESVSKRLSPTESSPVHCYGKAFD